MPESYYPSLKEFARLARTANVIPVYAEVSADLDTPVSSYLKLDKDEYSFLLESVEGQEKIARYSFLGTRPSLVFQSKGTHIEIIEHSHHDGRRTVRRFISTADPLATIEEMMAGFTVARLPGLPRFCGGFVGFMGYDMVRFFEDIPDKNPDELKTADALFLLADTLLVFDHVNHRIKIVSNCVLPPGHKVTQGTAGRLYRQALHKISAIQKDLARGLRQHEQTASRKRRSLKITSNFEKSAFCGIVNKAKRYIRKGDIIQVVLSQRFRVRLKRKPFDIYRSLRSLNPSPYMFFLRLGRLTLIGSSPELLVRCEDGLVQTRPIAGTRWRGRDEAEDTRLEKQLSSDAKEKAEHLMLVDLGRNDLGRVCKPGTVRVNSFMAVERYSHVMHLVSDVSGRLDRRYTGFDVLRACFPAGTVSGSPKVRAMQIIDELENRRRGPYAGSVGYFSFSGNLDTCITLRTIVVKDGYAYVQAGAGIVADSKAAKEYQETVNKAKALFEALAQ